MEQPKNNKAIIALLVVIIVILSILCILFATETIVFNSNSVDNNANENHNQNENTDLPEWANYLLAQNITEITYKKGTLEHDEATNTEKCTPAKTLTTEQLTQILSEMTKSKLRKFDAGGFGGPCWGGITVKYDNKEFSIYMSQFIITDNNDSHIVSLLEQEKYTYDSPLANPEEDLWVYEYDWDTSYIDTLF